jgi:membrane protein implicated in regulation of membrane protease activity
MSNPNNALSAWQLAVMAVVVVAVLAAWLVAIYLAAREPRRDGATPTSPSETTGSAAAGTGHDQRARVGAAGPRPHG